MATAVDIALTAYYIFNSVQIFKEKKQTKNVFVKE